MAFIEESGTVISFAEYSDLAERDQRLFENNEGLTDTVVEESLIRATQRILNKIRSSSWWRQYYVKRDPSLEITTLADIPAVDPNKIQDRLEDFTELCVYWALADYILPSVANFGDDGDDDRSKMGYYENRRESLYSELISAGDWYDFDNDGTVDSDEQEPGNYNLRRYR